LRPSARFALVASAVGIIAVFSLFNGLLSSPRPALANAISLSVSSATMNSLDVIQVTAVFDKDEVDPVTVSVSPISGGATLIFASCTVDSNEDGIFGGSDAACLGSPADSDPAVSIFTLSAGTVTGLETLQPLNQRFQLVLSFSAACGVPVTFTFDSVQSGIPTPSPAASRSVACALAAPTPTLTPVTAATPTATCPERVFLNRQGEPGCSVVVTANPNVVACGGTSIITASVRNEGGHALPGFGYHFSTDNGLLVVGPPPTADTEQAIAILQILPGMPSATVLVSVGFPTGTIEKQITVQQYCPAENSAPSTIKLTSSSGGSVNCGGSTFIGATVRDARALAPAENTEVAFMVTSGKLDPDKAGTVNGAVHTAFTADAAAVGSVQITAASGSSFGSMTLQVNCGGAVAGRTGISPPNTGDGGLAAAR
jgi:hypothetical protein